VALSAFLFVNWIFWATLASGTLLVVGATERLGGTTRGYRLFMAWLGVALAAVWLLSELALPGGVVAAANGDLRRLGVLGFGAGSLAYLAASLAGWPRSGLAIGTGGLGLATTVILALAGGTQSPPLFAGQLVLASLALGAVCAAMLLGHWYLVTPRLSPLPLRRMMWLLIGALTVQALAFGVGLLAVRAEPIDGGLLWLTWLRFGIGIALPIGITVLALLASRAASLQASTGLLYVGLALVVAGTIAGSSLSYLTGVPV